MKKIYLALVCILAGLSVWSQSVITGKVSDNNGDPLPGASVQLKGSSIGTITDVDGNYSLEVNDTDNATLVISFVGYLNQEIAIKSRSTIPVTLEADVQALSEVVVVGYGTQQKKNVTGSISVVDVDEINKQVEQNVQSLLQGRVAGLNITPASGAPGAGMQVNIRGSSSANAGTQPLYVIDGVQVGGGERTNAPGEDQPMNPSSSPLSLLNPQDIESIQVLKDAASTAIYGARGANGVIIITTKKGKYAQKAQVNISSQVGVQSLHNKMDLMNGQQHAEFLNEYLINRGQNPGFSDAEISGMGAGTDWQDEIVRSGTEALLENHQISVSGGSESVNYYFSGSYFDQDGIVLNTGLERYTFRSNLDFDVNDRVGLSARMTYSESKNVGGTDDSGSDNVRGPIQKAYATSPTISVFDDEGDYIVDWVESNKPENPVWALRDITSNVVTKTFLGNFALDANLMDGLDFRASLGLDISNAQGQYYFPGRSSYLGGLTNGRADLTAIENKSWINEYTLTYAKTFADHSLSVVVGSSLQGSKSYAARTTALGFPDDNFRLNALENASTSTNAFSDYSERTLAGFLGRVNYEYGGKYLLAASFRRDGASVFGENNKWGNFGAVSAGWRISEESFLQNSDLVSDLKLRAGYGVTGNQAIGAYSSFPAVGSGGQYIFGGVVYTGTAPSQLANSDLGWEETITSNIGVDFGLFNNRLYGTVEYFDKTTEDQLLLITLDYTNGVEANKIFNTGSQSSNGFEVVLGGSPVRTSDFEWTTEVNMTFLNNEVLSNGPSAPREYQGFSTAISGVISKIDSVGQPFGSFYGYRADGVWNTQNEINQAASAGYDTTGIRPGELKIMDINGDSLWNQDDRVILGNSIPDLAFGFNNTFRYKGLSLTVFIRGMQGFEAVNGAAAEIFNSVNSGSNKHVDLLNRWTPSNTESNIPQAGSRSVYQDALLSTYVEDASYIKIQNIQLGYTFTNLPGWISSAKVYLSGQNLATFTSYSGVDPALISTVGGRQGIDFAAYPSATTYLIGVNLGF